MTHPNLALMQEIFGWFNRLADPKNPVRRDEIKRYFAADAVMSTNGAVKCRGTDALVQHFEEIREKLRSFEVEPLQKSLADDRHVAAVYEIPFVARNGDEGRIVANVFWTIEKGQVSVLDEWVYVTGTPIEFDRIN